MHTSWEYQLVIKSLHIETAGLLLRQNSGGAFDDPAAFFFANAPDSAQTVQIIARPDRNQLTIALRYDSHTRLGGFKSPRRDNGRRLMVRFGRHGCFTNSMLTMRGFSTGLFCRRQKSISC